MGRQQASKVYKTKRKTRDADQILNDDLKSHAAVHALENQKFDEYLPGLAQHYCIPCAKYFESDVALTAHKRKKVHKRQLRNLKFGPYTSEEASAGAGRDVQKHLAKMQDQERLLRERSDQLDTPVNESHKKLSKRTKPVTAEMEVEAEEEAVPDKEEEISV